MDRNKTRVVTVLDRSGLGTKVSMTSWARVLPQPFSVAPTKPSRAETGVGHAVGVDHPQHDSGEGVLVGQDDVAGDEVGDLGEDVLGVVPFWGTVINRQTRHAMLGGPF